MNARDGTQTARLLADSSRATMLDALMGGQWLSAGELAAAARVAPPTASEHLAQLLEGRLVAAKRQGRHRYFALAGPQVAEALEALAAISPPAPPVRSLRESIELDHLRAGRTCYDHLAGRLGVGLTNGLLGRGWLSEHEGGWRIGASGADGFARLGIDLALLRERRRPLTRSCIDWTERRPHLAGALGAALAHRLDALAWTERRTAEGRAVRLTPLGCERLHALLGVDLREPPQRTRR